MNLYLKELQQRLIYIKKFLRHKKFINSEFDTNWLAKEKIFLNIKTV